MRLNLFKTLRSILAYWLLLASLFYIFIPNSAQAETFSHENWDSVLQTHVNPDGYVDYDALFQNRDLFNQYLDSIKTQGPQSTPDLFPHNDAKLAYYINAYNALVFEGVLARGPEDKSVWSGLISGLNFFRLMDVTFDNTRSNLQSLEDDIIRAQFNDPRIHAAINCASISCPRLPQQAFSPNTLQQQLDSAMREFINSPQHAQINHSDKTIKISKIFKWFEEDFIQYEQNQGNTEPTIQAYLNRFLPDEGQIDARYQVSYLDYDKGINSQKNQPISN